MTLPFEHFLVLTAFAFPPLLVTVLLTIVLASFGKSLGLRERYVNGLIRIFEWGAGEIRERREQTRRMNSRARFHVHSSASEEDEEDSDGQEGGAFYGHGAGGMESVGSYCSLEMDDIARSQQRAQLTATSHSMGYGSLSSPSLCRRATRDGSQASLASTSSDYRHRHSSGRSGRGVLNPVSNKPDQFQARVSSLEGRQSTWTRTSCSTHRRWSIRGAGR